jgi:hypothetical protein
VPQCSRATRRAFADFACVFPHPVVAQGQNPCVPVPVHWTKLVESAQKDCEGVGARLVSNNDNYRGRQLNDIVDWIDDARNKRKGSADQKRGTLLTLNHNNNKTKRFFAKCRAELGCS